jgi:putative tryptophan/tyrosine transport system substrate-binding protein
MLARRPFLSTIGGALALPLAVRAQQVPKIGFLYPGVAASMPTRIAALREGLRSGGYGQADRVEILARSSEGDPTKLALLAAELLHNKVDVLVPVSVPGIRAATATTTVIPIVAHDLESDPVANGFVASLARPGGNLTGLFSDFPEFGMKWLELLKEAMPALSSAVVFRDPAASSTQWDAVQAAGRLLKVNLQMEEVRAITDVERAFDAAAERKPDAIIVLVSPIFGTDPKMIADLALAHRIPIATIFTDIARAGGLLAYGPNLLDTFRQLGAMIGKVLQGTRPADLPVERPTKFEMVVNLKTAKVLGLSLPPSVLLRADEVIE